MPAVKVTSAAKTTIDGTATGASATTDGPALTFPLAPCAGIVSSNGGEAGGDAASIALRNCRHWLLSTASRAISYGNGSLAPGQEPIFPGSDSWNINFGGTQTSSSLSPSSLPNNHERHDGSLGAGVVYTGANDTAVIGKVNNDFEDFYEQLFASPEMKLREHLALYVFPIIIVLGNITNVIVLLVFRRNKLRASSVAFYLSAYAIANLCVLDLMLGVTWVCGVFEKTHITMLADWTCRLWTFISNVITYSGIWLVLAANVDRLIFIKSPTKAQGYCTMFAAKAVVSFVMIGLIVVSIHAMWTYELHEQGCFVSFKQDLHTIIWPWWSATIYSYTPLLLLIILSIVQLVTLCVRRVRHQSPPGNRAHGDGGGENFVSAVLVVSISLFVLTVPNSAINLVDIHLPVEWLEPYVIARIELAKNISDLLLSLNNSILGCVLFVCSGDFRAECLALLRTPCCSLKMVCNCCPCCRRRTRMVKSLEMRSINSKTEANNTSSNSAKPQVQVDYELCNNNEECHVTDV